MRTSCPKCGAVFTIGQQVVGRSVSCRKCGGIFVVQVLQELGDADVLQEVKQPAVAAPPTVPPTYQPAVEVEPVTSAATARPMMRTVQAGGLPGLSVVIILLYLVLAGVFFASVINFVLGVVDWDNVHWGRMVTLGVLVLGVYPLLLLTLAVRVGVFISEKVLKVRLSENAWLASCAVGVTPMIVLVALGAMGAQGILPRSRVNALFWVVLPGALYVVIHLVLGFPWRRGWAAFAITLPLWLLGLGAMALAVNATKDAFPAGSMAMRSPDTMDGGATVPGLPSPGANAPGDVSSRIEEAMRRGRADAQGTPAPRPTSPAPTGQLPSAQESVRQAQEVAVRRAQEAAERTRAMVNANTPRVDTPPRQQPGGAPAGIPPQAAEAVRQAMANAPTPNIPMPGGPGSDRTVDPGFREPTAFSSYATVNDAANLAPARQVVAAGYGGYVAAVQQDKLGNTIVEVYPPTLTQKTASLKMAATPETRFAVSNDGQYVLAVTSGAVCSAGVWSTATGERIQNCDLGSGGTPVPLGFTTNGTVTLLWSDRNEYWLQVIEIKSGRGKGVKWTLPALGVFGYTCNAANVAISPDGKMIAVVDGEYQLRLIDPVSGTVRRKMPVPFGDDRSAGVTAIAFSSDGKQVAILYDQDRANGASAICVGTVNVTGSKLVPLKFGKNLRQQAGDRFAGAFDKGDGRKMDWMADDRTLLLYGQLMVETKNGTVVGRVCEVPETGFGPTMPDGQLQLGGDSFLLSYPKGAAQKEHVYKLLAIDAKGIGDAPAEGQ